MRHTTGPWERDDDNQIYTTIGGVMIATVYTAEGFRCWNAGVDAGDGGESGRAESVTECEANARLIAAAPDLLDALKGMTAFFSPKPGQGVVIDCVVKALYAIEKAEGRS